MKLIESKAELVLQQEGLEGVFKQIELAGRTAYHSLDKITPDSAKGFVDRMIKSKHGAALEHGTVYLKIPYNLVHRLTHPSLRSKYFSNPYTRVDVFYETVPVLHSNEANMVPYIAVTTNYRVLVENNWLRNLKYQCKPTQYHEKRYTIRFTCSRAIAQELTRHRVFSFLMESQRYINYSKERHGGEITYIIPSWLEGMILPCSYNSMIGDIEVLDKIEDDSLRAKAAWFTSAFIDAEKCYFEALNNGCTPQQARDVLPNATKTELIMTGFASDWRFFFDLRYYGETGKPHPDMELLASKAREELIKAGLWEDIIKYPSRFDKNDTEGKTN